MFASSQLYRLKTMEKIPKGLMLSLDFARLISPVSNFQPSPGEPELRLSTALGPDICNIWISVLIVLQIIRMVFVNIQKECTVQVLSGVWNKNECKDLISIISSLVGYVHSASIHSGAAFSWLGAVPGRLRWGN